MRHNVINKKTTFKQELIIDFFYLTNTNDTQLNTYSTNDNKVLKGCQLKC